MNFPLASVPLPIGTGVRIVGANIIALDGFSAYAEVMVVIPEK